MKIIPFLIALLFAACAAQAASIQALVSWKDNSDNEAGFAIERSIGTGAFVEIARVAANVALYRDDNLLPDTIYTYRVRAHSVGGAGYSAYSNTASARTPIPPPEAPGQVTVVVTVVTTAAPNGAAPAPVKQ